MSYAMKETSQIGYLVVPFSPFIHVDSSKEKSLRSQERNLIFKMSYNRWRANNNKIQCSKWEHALVSHLLLGLFDGHTSHTFFGTWQWFPFIHNPFYLSHKYNYSMIGKDKVLSWIQRLKIAVDCARGLMFLHTYPNGCIIHRDIKVKTLY